MSLEEILNNMDEGERILYLSAKQVKESTFWKYLMNTMMEYGENLNQRMLTKLMEGDEKAAVIAGAQIQGLDWAIKTMETVVQDVENEALHQEQEEDYAR